MKKINVIIVMAGFGARLELDYNKALYEINQIPLFMYSVNKFSQLTNLNKLYLVVNENDFDIVKNISGTIIKRTDQTMCGAAA